MTAESLAADLAGKPDALAALARGDLVARPGEGAVEAVLQRLAGAPGG